MTERDPQQLADQLEGEADDLQEQSDRLENEVQDARQDWERKRSDPSVPGANPTDAAEEERGDQSGWGRESDRRQPDEPANPPAQD